MLDSERPHLKPWLRVTAFITVLAFTTTNVVRADGVELLQTEPEAARAEIVYPTGQESFFETLRLPESIGQIKKQFQGSRDRLVIHIQDAHANEEAQRNIGAIIEYFAAHHGLKLVSLEGASGPLWTELFSFFPNKKALGEVADYFLREARLTGPEHEAILRRPELELYGVEEGEVYEENRKAYLEALDSRVRDEEVLEGLGKVLGAVGRFVFSEKLREVMKGRERFEEGGRELVGYVRKLVEVAREENIALHDYPGMHSLLELVELEGEIDFDAAERETDTLIEDLKKVLSRERLSRFLTNTVQFRMKKMKRAEYFRYLEGEIRELPEEVRAGEGSITARYGNVLRHLRYMQLYDSIGLEIFEELEVLERAIKNKLFRSEEEVMLDRLMKIYGITRKMFEFTLTKQDAEFYYTFKGEFKGQTFRDFLTPLLRKYHFSYGLPPRLEILDQDLARVERFYAAALKRDRILIERAVGRMEESGQKVSVVVTGGFHTPGIEAYLREKDYSYLVVAPRMEKGADAARDARLYEDAVRQKPLALEKLLVEAYFPPVVEVLSDPQFQMSAERLLPNVSERGPLLSYLTTGRSELRLARKFGLDASFLTLAMAASMIREDFDGQFRAVLEAIGKGFAEGERGPLEALVQRFRGVLHVEGEGEDAQYYLYVPVPGRRDRVRIVAQVPYSAEDEEERIFGLARRELQLKRGTPPVILPRHALFFSGEVDLSLLLVNPEVQGNLRDFWDRESREKTAVPVPEEAPAEVPKIPAVTEIEPDRDLRLLARARERFLRLQGQFPALSAWKEREKRALQYQLYQVEKRGTPWAQAGLEIFMPQGYDRERGIEINRPEGESLMEFTDRVTAWIRDSLGQAGQELEERAVVIPSVPKALLQALDSPETIRFEALLEMIRADREFTAYFLSSLMRMTEKQFVPEILGVDRSEIGMAGQKGYLVIQYRTDQHSPGFIKQVAAKVAAESPATQILVLVRPEEKSLLSELNLALRGVVRVDVGDAAERVREWGKEVSGILQITADLPEEMDTEMLQAALLGAVPLSQGTLLLMGVDQPIDSKIAIIPFIRILQSAITSAIEAEAQFEQAA